MTAWRSAPQDRMDRKRRTSSFWRSRPSRQCPGSGFRRCPHRALFPSICRRPLPELPLRQAGYTRHYAIFPASRKKYGNWTRTLEGERNRRVPPSGIQRKNTHDSSLAEQFQRSNASTRAGTPVRTSIFLAIARDIVADAPAPAGGKEKPI